MKSSNSLVSLTGVNLRWWKGYKETINQAMQRRNGVFDDYEMRAIQNIFTLEDDASLFCEPFHPSRKQFNFIKDMAEKAKR